MTGEAWPPCARALTLESVKGRDARLYDLLLRDSAPNRTPSINEYHGRAMEPVFDDAKGKKRTQPRLNHPTGSKSPIS